MGNRPPVPRELQQRLMQEVGWRCAICRVPEPLEFEHIDGWAVVRKHKFEDMIVLCRNCHGRKRDTNSPRHINRLTLKRVKQSLMNGRRKDARPRRNTGQAKEKNIDPGERRRLIIQARGFIAKTVGKNADYAYFQQRLAVDPTYLRLRPHLSEYFTNQLMRGRIRTLVGPGSGGIPGIAAMYSKEIEDLERRWGLLL